MAIRTRPDSRGFAGTAILWIGAPSVSAMSFVAIFRAGYLGLPLVLPLACLSVGLGVLGFSEARNAGFHVRFYLPVLGGLVALLPTASALWSECSAPEGENCRGFFFLHLALVLVVALLSGLAVLWFSTQARAARESLWAP